MAQYMHLLSSQTVFQSVHRVSSNLEYAAPLHPFANAGKYLLCQVGTCFVMRAPEDDGSVVGGLPWIGPLEVGTADNWTKKTVPPCYLIRLLLLLLLYWGVRSTIAIAIAIAITIAITVTIAITTATTAIT